MDIILTGSVAYDYLMTFPGLFKEYILADKLEHIGLSFLVDGMVKRRGGTAPNIAYTLALLGGKPRVMATVGEDFADYRAQLDSVGRFVNLDFLTIEEDLSFVLAVEAVQDVHQGGLAGPVLTQQGVNLSLFKLEVDVIVGQNAGEAFGDVLHVES